MPFLGIGLHVLVAIFFAVHAIRTRQEFYWLVILFTFPLLGSAVYCLAIYLPASKLEKSAKKTVSAIVKTLDPERELRESRSAFEYTPTAQNQMRLAKALLEAELFDEAAKNYEDCLKGPFSKDPEIKICAARAFLQSGRFADAMQHLEALRSDHSNFRTREVSLLIARTLAAAGRHQEARREFEEVKERFGSFEVNVEFAIWAISSNEYELAETLQSEITETIKHWDKHTRVFNLPLIRRLEAAKKVVKKAS